MLSSLQPDERATPSDMDISDDDRPCDDDGTDVAVEVSNFEVSTFEDSVQTSRAMSAAAARQATEFYDLSPR